MLDLDEEEAVTSGIAGGCAEVGKGWLCVPAVYLFRQSACPGVMRKVRHQEITPTMSTHRPPSGLNEIAGFASTRREAGGGARPDAAAGRDAGGGGALAVVVDAEVTSYLMMGALSPGLKRHSVSLFEGAYLCLWVCVLHILGPNQPLDSPAHNFSVPCWRTLSAPGRDFSPAPRLLP